MKKGKRISVILPAYNEEKRITSTIKAYTTAFEDLDLVVVCNGCKDKTFTVCSELKKQHKNLRVFDYPEKLGKGGAILKGFHHAEGDLVGFVDADNAFELQYVRALIHALEDFDVAIASKWQGRTFLQVEEPFIKKILGRGWNLMARAMLGLNFKDTQGGAKFFRKSALESLNDNFRCKGFDFDVELLHKLKKTNAKIVELYIPNHAIDGTTFSLKYIPGMFMNMFVLFKRRLFG